jgi:excisionase family DNA binding protein
VILCDIEERLSRLFFLTLGTGFRYPYTVAENDILTKKQVQEYLQVSRGTLDRLMATQEIPYFKIRRHVRFKKVDIEAWLETKRVKQ